MESDRFTLTNDYEFNDNKKLLTLNGSFCQKDVDKINQLIDYMNQREHLLKETAIKYGNVIFELNSLRETISKTLNEEVKDCEILIEADNNDLYAKGRLVEIHNLIKILLK